LINSEKWLKSVYIYGSYRKIKTGVSLFGPPCTYKAAEITFAKTQWDALGDLTNSGHMTPF